jgi:hypothetical protein
MTLIIAALTASGIVLTADSRQTYRNQAGVFRVGSDSATKLFKLTDRCAVAISGRAFLQEQADQPFKNAGYFILRFADTASLGGKTIRDIAVELEAAITPIFATAITATEDLVEQEVAQKGGSGVIFQPRSAHRIPYTYKAADGSTVSDVGSVEPINAIVAGGDADGIGRAYGLGIPGAIGIERDTQSCGALWLGQTDVIGRIVKGWAPEIYELPEVKKFQAQNPNVVEQALDRLEYIINWGAITLQDAVDFCVLMTRTTESIQRFSDGTILKPGGVPGVGGSIDVVVLTPEEGLRWLSQKELSATRCD